MPNTLKHIFIMPHTSLKSNTRLASRMVFSVSSVRKSHEEMHELLYLIIIYLSPLEINCYGFNAIPGCIHVFEITSVYMYYPK